MILDSFLNRKMVRTTMKIPKNYTCNKVKDKKLIICHPKKHKSTKAPKHSRGHKGHRTRRGLAQDQKRKSQEKHEVAYRRSKRRR